MVGFVSVIKLSVRFPHDMSRKLDTPLLRGEK